MRMLINSKHLELTNSQEESINLLVKRLRNNFQHFKPRLESIEIHGIPQIALDALEVIHFLARKTNTYVHLNSEEGILVDKLVQESIDFIRELNLYKEMVLGKELYQKENSTSSS